MSDLMRTPAIDAMVAPLLKAGDDAEALRLAEEAARHADAAMRGALARRLKPLAGRPGDPAAESLLAEARAEAVAHLVTRLVALRRGASGVSEARSIGDLRSHAAGLAARVGDGWVRRRHVARARLRNRLRYLLARDRRFLLRATPDVEWRSGLAGRDAQAFASGEASGPGRRIPEAVPPPRTKETVNAADPEALATLIVDLLTRAGGPVDLEHLTDTVAERAGLPEAAALPAARPVEATLAGSGAAQAAASDPAAWLVRLWTEIGALPSMARAVILFNLRDADGHGVVGLFPSAGVASLRSLSTALGVTPEKLAEAWKSLPLDDPGIAARLGVTRPQIALLRRAARERLARRMAAR
ncbi:MAG TPA: hypothetical protein VMQ62_05190 [Dongiaceae bacterium]|nr:hypothetical protein [Dongiaceae bacterium]